MKKSKPAGRIALCILLACLMAVTLLPANAVEAKDIASEATAAYKKVLRKNRKKILSTQAYDIYNRFSINDSNGDGIPEMILILYHEDLTGDIFLYHYSNGKLVKKCVAVGYSSIVMSGKYYITCSLGESPSDAVTYRFFYIGANGKIRQKCRLDILYSEDSDDMEYRINKKKVTERQFEKYLEKYDTDAKEPQFYSVTSKNINIKVILAVEKTDRSV